MKKESQGSPRIASIEGVILIANDFAGQANFYRYVLGLEQAAHYQDAVFFNVGLHRLGIFARTHHPEGTRRLGKCDHGLSHLEFGVDKRSLTQITARLVENGAHAYGDNYADADGNLFHFTDPRCREH